MGGDTIIDIFKRGIDSVSNIKNIVLSNQGCCFANLKKLPIAASE